MKLAIRPRHFTAVLAVLAIATLGMPGTASAAVGSTDVIVSNATAHLVDMRAFRGNSPMHGTGPVTSDFDGDGVDDIAIVGQSLPADGSPLAGNILVVRYSTAPYTDYVSDTGPGGSFGTAIATGDFNRDGYTDLAIGDGYAPVTVGGTSVDQAGIVWVIPGGPDGLDVTRAIQITEQTAGVPGTAEADDEFGNALAAGDLTGDGYADLAIGSPGESIGSAVRAGGVTVLRGGPHGITTTGATFLDQNSPGIPGTAEPDDKNGYALAIGDVTGDHHNDLAIASPGENVSGHVQAGMVTLIPGTSIGLSSSHVTDTTGGSLTTAAVWPFNIGATIVIADTDGDGRGEVIVGAPESQRNKPPIDPTGGAVFVLRGTSTGISATGALTIDEDTSGVPGTVEETDAFGFSVAAGDLTGDGRADLLIGTPYESIGRHDSAGTVYLVPSSASGLLPAKATVVDQDTAGVPGAVATNDLFGFTVAVLNLGGSRRSALVGTLNDGETPTSISAGSLTEFTGAGGVLQAVSRTTAADLTAPDGTTLFGMPAGIGGVSAPSM